VRSGFLLAPALRLCYPNGSMSDQPAPGVESGQQAHGHTTGVFTLLFTDVVGSTAMKQLLGDRVGVEIMQQHHQIVRDTLRRFAGAEEISTAGDSFLVIFPKPSDAVRFALVLQSRLRQFNEGRNPPVPDRVGLHLGEVVIEDLGGSQRDVHGMQVDTAARVMGLAEANQILMTRPVFDNARQSLRGEEIEGVGALEWLNHGRYELKGVEEPVEICEVRSATLGILGPPKTSDKARHVADGEEPVLGWRPAVGQQVGTTDWRLEEKLGEGGFGEVWLGRHDRLKERRVFKFCFQADLVRSLKRELTLFRLLKARVGEHPNIVRLHEVHLDEPPFFLEEDYVEGRDLARWCAAQGGVEQVPRALRLEIVAQAADALQAAHEAGVIHRDVKPANILMGRPKLDGRSPPVQVKLTDFGIGQVISEEYLAGVTRAGFTQTMLPTTSTQTGTQLYLAPELLAGRPASTRSDIYSLGVVLYQLLVGDFRRPVTTDWARSIDDPLLREDLQRCFAGNPEERFTAAGQLADNLRHWEARRAELARQRAEQAERQRLAAQAEHRRRLLLGTGAIGVALLAVAGALGYGLREARNQEFQARQQAYAADMSAAAGALQKQDHAQARGLLGHYLPRLGTPELRGVEWRLLWQAAEGQDHQVFRLGSPVVTIALAPNQRWLLTGGLNHRLAVWDVAARRKITELDLRQVASPAQLADVCPQQELVAASTASGIAIHDLSNRQVVTNLAEGEPPLQFSPDGRWLVAVQRTNLVAWKVGSWSPRVLATGCPSGSSLLAFTPDSRFVVYGNREAVATETAEGEPPTTLVVGLEDTSEPKPLTDVPAGSELRSLRVSPDGRWLAAGTSEGNIAIFAFPGGQPVTNWGAHPRYVYGLAFSPDGRTLASGGSDQVIRLWRTGTWEPEGELTGLEHQVWGLAYAADGLSLFAGSADGTARQFPAHPPPAPQHILPLTTENMVLGPAWQGDGLWTCSESPRALQLWDAMTTNPVRVLNLAGRSNLAGLFVFPYSLRHGRWLCWLGTNTSIAVMDLENPSKVHRVELPGPAGNYWTVSRDGRLLAGSFITASNTVQSAIWHLDAGTVDPLPRNFAPDSGGSVPPYGATFSADGRRLGLMSRRPGDFTGMVWNVDRRKPQAMLTGFERALSTMAFSPDSRTVATATWNGEVQLWDADTGQPDLPPLRGSRTGVYFLQFAQDGRSLMAAADDWTLFVWQLASHRLMLTLPQVLVPSQTTVLAGSDDSFWWLDMPPTRGLLGGTVWPDGKGRLRATRLLPLAEIDALEKQRAQSP